MGVLGNRFYILVIFLLSLGTVMAIDMSFDTPGAGYINITVDYNQVSEFKFNVTGVKYNKISIS